jgi:hypothetical protein
MRQRLFHLRGVGASVGASVGATVGASVGAVGKDKFE